MRYKTDGSLPISGRDYIEKLIQVSFTLPPIRESVMTKFIESLDISEKEKEYTEIVAKGTGCNPRKVKMFLNTLRIRHEIAERTGGEIKPELSAKLFLIEYTFPEFYKDVMKYRKQHFLNTVERLAKGERNDELIKEMKGSETLQKYYKNEDLTSVLKDEPFFYEINIEPYIYFAGETLAVEEVRPTEERMMEFLIVFMDLMLKHPEIFEKFKQYVSKDQTSRL